LHDLDFLFLFLSVCTFSLAFSFLWVRESPCFVSSVYAIWNYSSLSTFKYEIPRFPLVCPSCSVQTDYYYCIRSVLCFDYLVWWSLFLCREQALQDQLQHAKDSVSNMQKLHEIAQNQLFELRAQSGNLIVFTAILVVYFTGICNICSFITL